MPVWAWILLAVAGVIVLLLGIACARAAALKSREPKGTPPAVDREKAAAYAEDLAALIRCDTVNEAGSDASAKFAAFREVLASRFPRTFETLERTLIGDALLLKWKGADPQRGAVALLAHSDVVPAGGEWEHPPFSGDIAGGRVWGRGAMDDKGALCAVFEAVESLLAEGFAPPCDVYIASSNNEETMGDGAPNTVQWLTDRGVRLDLVLDEGGAVIEAPMPGLSGSYAMLGVLEKGYADVRFVAQSDGGHSSTPPRGTPLARLAAFVHRVETRSPFKKRITPPVRAMFAALAPHMAFPFRLLFGNLWLFSPLIKAVMPKVSAQAGALLQTTCAFTMARGSGAPNVIPAEASVTANLRFMLHQGKDESLRLLEDLAAKYGLTMEVIRAHDCSPLADTSGPLFGYIRSCVRDAFPEAGCAPYVMLGGTDARHYAGMCPCTVRFAPTILTPQQLASMHARNENLGVDALARAVGFYRHVLTHFPRG